MLNEGVSLFLRQRKESFAPTHTGPEIKAKILDYAKKTLRSISVFAAPVIKIGKSKKLVLFSSKIN